MSLEASHAQRQVCAAFCAVRPAAAVPGAFDGGLSEVYKYLGLDEVSWREADGVVDLSRVRSTPTDEECASGSELPAIVELCARRGAGGGVGAVA